MDDLERGKIVKPLTADQMKSTLVDTSWGGNLVINGEIENVELMSGFKMCSLVITIKPGPDTTTYRIDIEKISEHPTDPPLPTRPLERKTEL